MKPTIMEESMGISNNLEELEKRMNILNDNLIRIEMVVNRLDHALSGNGQPGLITKFNLYENELKNLPKLACDINQFKGAVNFLKWGLGGSVIANIVLIVKMVM